MKGYENGKSVGQQIYPRNGAGSYSGAYRLRNGKDDVQGVTAALFEADGAAWKHQAIQSIKEYLQIKLDGQPVVILA